MLCGPRQAESGCYLIVSYIRKASGDILPISGRDMDSAKENTMADTSRTIDPLPESFDSEEQAGEFRDTHSLADYEEHLEATDDSIHISERIFEVQIAEDVFKKLQQQAASLHQPLPKIADEILRRELTR